MPKERTPVPIEPRKTLTEYIKLLLPNNFDSVGKNGFWASKEIRDGEWHGQDHVVMVLGLVNHLASAVEQRHPNISIDRVVQNLVAIRHDSKRVDDGDDIFHASRASNAIRSLKIGVKTFEAETIKKAAFVCFCHNFSIDKILENDTLRNSVDLRFFLFCDVLAMVRYENGNDGFEITPELLGKILPNTFSNDELKSLLDRTRQWHKTAKEISRRESTKGNKDAMLEAGQLTGFFS